MKNRTEEKRKYYLENKERICRVNKARCDKKRDEIRAKTLAYYHKNKDKIKEYHKKNKDKINASRRDYRKRNNERVNEWQREYIKNRKKNDPNYKLAHSIRNRIRMGLKRTKKHGSTIELIDCSFMFLKQYLESKFTDGMSWDNYGKWHVDHIKPIASFDLKDVEQQKQCFHYTNLQPLWAIDNLKKGKKYEQRKNCCSINKQLPRLLLLFALY